MRLNYLITSRKTTNYLHKKDGSTLFNTINSRRQSKSRKRKSNLGD